MDIEIKNSLQKFIDLIEPKIKAIDGPDYYPAQSAIKINPDLLILGINPAGNKKLSESSFPSKAPENLIYDSNQYLENPDWNISKKLNKIFSGADAMKAYKNAVIINYISLNTPSEEELGNNAYKDIINDCQKFSEHFIYNVLKPKQIVVLGPTLADMAKIKYHHSNDSVLRTEDDKSYLVLETIHKEIPHYIIYHPSTPALNGPIALELKKEYFNQLFQQ